MEKDIERLKVIDNIKSNIKENKLNSKVEINDETITEEDRERVVYKFDILRKNPINKVKKAIARNIANKFTDNINQDTEIIGLENVQNIETGAIITSNHFSPEDSTVIRFFTNKIGKKKKLNIIVEEENLLKDGVFGFLMNNCSTIPVSKSKEYTERNFYPSIKKLLEKKEFILIYPEEQMWFNYRKVRPFKVGAYHIAAKNNVPIIPCFIEIREKIGEYGENGFNKLKYILHIMPPIYPDKSKSLKENKEEMRLKDFELKKQEYEKAYNKKMTYEFSDEDIAGFTEGQEKLNEAKIGKN